MGTAKLSLMLSTNVVLGTLIIMCASKQKTAVSIREGKRNEYVLRSNVYMQMTIETEIRSRNHNFS